MLLISPEEHIDVYEKLYKVKTVFCCSIVEDINLMKLLDISKYYRLIGLTSNIVLLLYK